MLSKIGPIYRPFINISVPIHHYFCPATPTVLYMHACTGLKNLPALRAMARRGFAIVAPGSFARRFRPKQCDARSPRGGRSRYVFDFRQAESNYALTRMWSLPWIDARKMFLMGAGEGGLAAAHHRGASFRARVINAWTCHGSALVRGLAAPADEPVLALVDANDPRPGTCAAARAACPVIAGVISGQSGPAHARSSSARARVTTC